MGVGVGGWTKGMVVAGVACALVHSVAMRAESCTTQSGMTAAVRDELKVSATALAARVQAGDAPGLRALSDADLAGQFGAISEVVGSTAPQLKGGGLSVEQVYLLDASTLKVSGNGAVDAAQFFCNLNHSSQEAEFTIPGLPAGRYAFAMVDVASASPWRLSFLLRQENGRWLMAGMYPKPKTAAGHDGLWYWMRAREMVTRKQAWDAWLYLQEAETLLQPAAFVQSTHLEKLHAEETSAAPPAVSDGVTAEAPLVVKAKDGREYRFTGLSVDDSLGASGVDVAVRLKAEPLADQAAARRRNIDAMSALLGAYPEMRQAFHGVWVFAEVAGQPVYATEQAIADIP